MTDEKLIGDPNVICECGHSEFAHVEEPSSKWPCAMVDCVCDDFAIKDDSEPLLCGGCKHEFDEHTETRPDGEEVFGGVCGVARCECMEFETEIEVDDL